MAASSVATTTPLVIFPYLTLGTYHGNEDLFLLLCHFSLAGARVFPAIDFMQVSVVQLVDFRVMIHAYVPHYFFLYTYLMPAVINLNSEVLLPDTYLVQHFLMILLLLLCYHL